MVKSEMDVGKFTENGAWGIRIRLDWGAFYFWVVLAGIDIEFHIDNLRSAINWKKS